MSFGSRFYTIFRNPVDIGVQFVDLFVDWARVATDEEFGVASAFVQSWRDNVLGQMSVSGTGEQSVFQETFGPEGLLGAPIGALPVGVRNALGGGEGGMWDLTMENLQWTYKNVIDRPIGTLVTAASLNPLQERDPVTAQRTGNRGYNTKLFEWDTWQNIWDLTTDRSAGQALVLFSGNVDIYNPESLKEFKASPKYQLVSGIFDFSLNIGGDPAWIGARAVQWSRAVKFAKRQKIMGDTRPLWPEEVTDYIYEFPDGRQVPVTHIEPGLMPNRSGLPIQDKIRPAINRDALIFRTRSRKPIRVGGQKLHEILRNNPGRYPALARLLGGVADTLTIPGGVQKGSRRTTDSELWENWSWEPKWMNETPPTREILIDDIVEQTERRLQQIVIEETPRLLAQDIMPSTKYLTSGEAGLRPEFGLLPAARIPAVEQSSDTSNPVPWSLTENLADPITNDVREAFGDYQYSYRKFRKVATSRLSYVASPTESFQTIDARYDVDGTGPFSVSLDYANEFYQLNELIPFNTLDVFNWESRAEGDWTARTGWDVIADPTRIEMAIDELTVARYEYPGFDTAVTGRRELAAQIRHELERLKDGAHTLNNARDAANQRLIENENRSRMDTTFDIDGIRRQDILDDLEAIETEWQTIGYDIARQIERAIQLDVMTYYDEIVSEPYTRAKDLSLAARTGGIPAEPHSIERFYGAELWNLRVDSTFIDIIALRIYKDMPLWGRPFKNMVNHERWQLAKVYAHLANAMEPNTVAWLPFRNFQKYIAGDKETILAMRAQLSEMQHLWSLLRRIPGPAVSPQGDTAAQFSYDWETPFGPMDEPFAEWQKEFPAAWGSPQSLHWHFRELGLIRKNIASLDLYINELQTAGTLIPSRVADVEGIETIKQVDKTHVEGIIRILKRKERAHALLIQHYLFNPAALLDMATQAAKAELWKALDDLGIVQESFDTGIPMELLEGARETLIQYQNMRSMHADIFEGDPDFAIDAQSDYVYKGLDIKNVADLIDKGVLKSTADLIVHLGYAPLAENAAVIRFVETYLDVIRAKRAETGVEVAEKKWGEARQALLREFPVSEEAESWQDPTEVPSDAVERVGLLPFGGQELVYAMDHDWVQPVSDRSLLRFRVMPLAQGHIMEGARDVPDVLGPDRASPFAELVDRLYEMSNLPWQAILAADEATYKNLVQDTYAKFPEQHQLMNPELVIRGVGETLPEMGLDADYDGEGIKRIRTEDMLSPREVHEQAIDSMFESINLELPRTTDGLLMLMKPHGMLGGYQTFYEKSGLYDSWTTSRAYKFFVEKTLEGVIDLSNRHQTFEEIRKFLIILDDIDITKLQTKHQGTGVRLASGENISLLDVVLMAYDSNLPTWQGVPTHRRPEDKAEALTWSEKMQVDLFNTPATEIGPKLEKIINTALMGMIEALVPDQKFAGLDWTGPDVRANLMAILRDEMKATKRLLEESADATGKRYGNVQFTDIIGPGELGETIFVRKPISPSQVRQSIVLPRMDRWKRLEKALKADWKTIHTPGGKEIQVGLTPTTAAVRNMFKEGVAVWKTIMLLTPRWQLVVNFDSQLRNMSALDTGVALAALGASFDTLQVRWLRGAGIDIHAVVQTAVHEKLGGMDRARDIDEELADLGATGSLVRHAENYGSVEAALIDEQLHLRNVNWVGLVDIYNAKYELGELEQPIEKFVAEVIAKEYQAKRYYKRNTLLTGIGWWFGGPLSAGAIAGGYTAHQTRSLQKYAQAHIAESYAVAVRNEAWTMLQEAEELDIFNWLVTQYPDRYLVSSPGESDDLIRTITDPASRDLSHLPSGLHEGLAGSTEAQAYAKILMERNVLDAENIADFINTRFMEQVNLSMGLSYFPVGLITQAPFFRALSKPNQTVVQTRIDELARPLSARERADHSRIEAFEHWEYLVGDIGAVIDIIDIDPDFLQGEWFRRMAAETSQGIPTQLEFITAEIAERIYGENLTLLELAQEQRQTLLQRREAAEMLAHRVQAVTDYQRFIIQELQFTHPEIANRFETAAVMLAEAGYGSTQVGSTRISSAFGDEPQQQEMWRRNVSANPTARTQLAGGTHVQRSRERYQGSHQYDVQNSYERESFVGAYDNFMDFHIVPQAPAGVSAPQDYWRLLLRPVGEILTDREVASWLHREGRPVLEILQSSYDTPALIRTLIQSSRYEANSLIPTVFQEFDPLLKKVQDGNRIGWDTDVIPALDRLGNEIESFWDNWLRFIREPGIFDATFQEQVVLHGDADGHLQYLQKKIYDFTRTLRLEIPENYKPTGRAFVEDQPWDDMNTVMPLRRLLAANWLKTIQDNPGALLDGDDVHSIAAPSNIENFERLVAVTRNRPLVEQIRVAGRHTAAWEEKANAYDMPDVYRIAVVPLIGEQGLSDFGKTVNSSEFIDAQQTHGFWTRFKDKINKPLTNLAEVESVLSRSTLFAALENKEVLRRLQPFKVLGTGDSADNPVRFKISPHTLGILQDKARAQALKETRDVLYDLANRTKFEEALWAISPFFGAWQEVLSRWFSLAWENPVFVSRGLRAFAIAAAEDEDGETMIVMKLPDFFDAEIPEAVSFFGGMKLFGEMSVLSKMPLDWNLGSASMLSGTPGTGFLVQYAVSELLIRVPELSDALEWLIPYGLAEGDDPFTRFLASAAPAWAKNLGNVVGLDSKRRAATAGRVMVDILAEYYERGMPPPNTEQGRRDLEEEVERRTRMIYSIRALRSITIPVALQLQSPYMAILKEFWRVEDEHGSEVADEWILYNHPELWSATARNTLAKGVISATLPGHKAYEHHKEFAQVWPELGPFITGQTGAMDVQFAYNQAVRQIEEQTGRAARLSVTDHFYEATVTQGWREWKVYRNSLTDALFKRTQAPGGSGNINARSNYDLYQQRRLFIQELSTKFPSWGQEWNNVADPLTQRRILQGFREVLADEKFEYRPELEVIRQYIELHDRIAIQLEDRAAIHKNPIYERLSYKGNADLEQMWALGILQILTFPDFGNIYDRFFANIDTVKVSNSPRRPPPPMHRID